MTRSRCAAAASPAQRCNAIGIHEDVASSDQVSRFGGERLDLTGFWRGRDSRRKHRWTGRARRGFRRREPRAARPCDRTRARRQLLCVGHRRAAEDQEFLLTVDEVLWRDRINFGCSRGRVKRISAAARGPVKQWQRSEPAPVSGGGRTRARPAPATAARCIPTIRRGLGSPAGGALAPEVHAGARDLRCYARNCGRRRLPPARVNEAADWSAKLRTCAERSRRRTGGAGGGDGGSLPRWAEDGGGAARGLLRLM